ncbi:hypothetical protein PtA15_9A365 [Puccinia triticina]|uniref:Vacuolar fusion protein MON1 n=1 Tax=Puccinia triticina TaxID=208348 RepID=A0ABY7CSJ6_9BASI|nr:uncharacterized protein PtA15_9A365 [Puccinia triticina]WAQ88238.1 hypothetical protein PtA15_9A365 [Puccinia triticina]
MKKPAEQQLSHQRSVSSINNHHTTTSTLRTLLTNSPSKTHSTTTTTITLASPKPTTTAHTPRADDQKRAPAPAQPRKYHILTNAGKPVWSTEKEDENRPDGDLTSQMGLIQAVISIFELDDNDQLRYIDAGQSKIAVMSRPPLYFLAVSNWGEPESTVSIPEHISQLAIHSKPSPPQLRIHLEYLNLLVQSILSTTQLKKIFAQRPNYDLRGALSGTEAIFAGLVDRLQWDLSIMMASLVVYRCPPLLRARISKLITPSLTHPSPDHPDSLASTLLYSIVITQAQVVSVVRPKNHSVHPSDLQIILTTILSSKSIKSSESWIPICLPGYNPTGFLHAYVNFEPGIDVGLVLISKDRAGFYEAQRWSEAIFKDPVWAEFDRLHAPLPASSSSPSVSPSPSSSSTATSSSKTPRPDPPLTNSPCGHYLLEELGIPGLRHFVYKDKKAVQLSAPAWEHDYLLPANRQRLMANYQLAFDLIHPKQPKLIKKIHPEPGGQPPPVDTDLDSAAFSSAASLPPPLKFTLFKTPFESVIGWVHPPAHIQLLPLTDRFVFSFLIDH